MVGRKALQSQKYGEVGTIEGYLASLKGSPNFGPQVVHHEELAGCAAEFAEPEKPWPPALRAALDSLGVGPLYSHQAQAVDSIRANVHTVVATPTASGKSLIYNLPVFERILQDPASRALYLFPLKALAQDQWRAINDLAQGLPVEGRPTAGSYRNHIHKCQPVRIGTVLRYLLQNLFCRYILLTLTGQLSCSAYRAVYTIKVAKLFRKKIKPQRTPETPGIDGAKDMIHIGVSEPVGTT